MADKVGGAEIEITADDGQARSTVGGFFGFLQRTGQMAAGVATGIAIFEGITRTIRAASQSTIGANASMEQYVNTLSVVLKSNEKAKETLAWAEKFAASTPFEIPDIVEATTRLAAYGLKAQDVLEQTGNMAAVMGKPLMQAVEAVADAQTGELERLKEFGITKDMLIKKAAEMGKKEIVNAKGQITDMKGLNDALFALMDERFKDGMELQSKTFNGMVSNVKDAMGTMARELSKPLFEKLKSGLQSIVPLMSGVTQLVKGDVIGFSETVTKAFGQEKGLQIMKFFFTIRDGANKTKEVLGTFKSFLAGLFAIFQGNEDKGSSILEKLGFSAAQVQQIINAINLIKTYINTLIQNAITGFTMMSQFIIQAWSIIWPYLQPLLMQIVSFVGQSVSKLTAFWQENGAQIMAAVKNVFGFILATIQFIMPAVLFIIQMVWSNIQGVINGVLNIIMGLIKIFAGLFTGDFSKMWEGVKQLFKGAIEFVWNLMSLLFFGRIIAGIKSFVSQGITRTTEFWKKVVDIFKNLHKEIDRIVSNLVNSVINFFKNFYNQAKSIFQTAKTFGVNTFTALKDAVVNTARSMVDNVVSKITSFKDNLVTKFSDILSKAQFVFGKIKDAITKPVNEAKGKVQDAIESIKSIFSSLKLTLPKIKTPSFKVKNWSKNPADWIKAMPSIDVVWNAAGAVFNKPFIRNMGPYGLQGFGEAGPEAAIPLTDKVLGVIGRMISATMPQSEKNDASLSVIINSPVPHSPAEERREYQKILRKYALGLR